MYICIRNQSLLCPPMPLRISHKNQWSKALVNERGSPDIETAGYGAWANFKICENLEDELCNHKCKMKFCLHQLLSGNFGLQYTMDQYLRKFQSIKILVLFIDTFKHKTYWYIFQIGINSRRTYCCTEKYLRSESLRINIIQIDTRTENVTNFGK